MASPARVCLSLFLMLLVVPSVCSAGIIAADSFGYTAGQTLKDRPDGTGWKADWAGDSEPVIVSPGLEYTDSLGNTLTVAGNAVGSSSNDDKKGERDISGSAVGSNGVSVWSSAIFTGATGSGRASVSLEDKFFFGQGNNSDNGSNWSLSDQDGLVFTSSTAASGNTDFLVSLIEFSSGNETAWLWVNPVLDTAPSKSDALNGASGSSIKDFTFTKTALHFSAINDGLIDELRIGDTFADVSPFTAALDMSAIPEPGVIALIGFTGLLAFIHRRVRRTHVEALTQNSALALPRKQF